MAVTNTVAAAPLRYCTKGRRCPHKVSATQPCPVHPSKPWAGTAKTPRVRGRKLQALRKELFQREPLCRLCMANGRVVLATIRDHIVPLAEGGQDVEHNTQPICDACSATKSHAEAARGRERRR